MPINERTTPTVRLDGERIRSIREDKGLTQLYLAEVVGVSVDTVSRWENNRTDAVKRDNAAALATALEVELYEILREPQAANAAGDGDADLQTSPPNQPAGTAAKRRSRPVKAYALIAVALLCAAGAAWYWGAAQKKVIIEAVRLLPPYSPPKTTIPVVIDLVALRGKSPRVVVRERLPEGWTLEGAHPPPDQGPTSENVVKWIVTLGEGVGRVVYLTSPPEGARESSIHYFRGDVITPDRKEGTRINGPERIDLEYIHWADEDADFRIDDSEVLEALERMEAAGKLELDPTDLRRLWGADEYWWDRDKGRFTIPGE